MRIHGEPSSTTSPRAGGPGAGVATAIRPAPRVAPNDGSVAIAIRGLTRTYHAGVIGCSARVEALRAIDLDVRAGEVLGVLGPKGAGKSTLLLCTAGLLQPDSGTIAWFGGSSAAGRPPFGVAYVADRAAHYGFMTVRESVEYYALLRDPRTPAPALAIDRALAASGLLENASVRMADLPWNTGARLSLAQALVAEPRVLLLDETLSALDPGERRGLVAALGNRLGEGTTVIVSGETVDALEGFADRIVVMVGGRVTDPVPAAAVRRPPILEVAVATPPLQPRRVDPRVAEQEWDRHVLRVPLDGTSPEAILARCRSCGIRVEGSRVLPVDRIESSETIDSGASTRVDLPPAEV